MSDAVSFCEAACVYQPSFRFHLSQSKTEINASLCCGFDLREDVVAIRPTLTPGSLLSAEI